MQKILIGIVIALAIIGVGTFIFVHNNTTDVAVSPSPTPTTPSANPTPIPNPTPTPTPTSGSKTYTLAQVATHSTQSSCWTAINGKVYDVTSWISQHPGGQQAILSLCGKDGSSAFSNQHGGQARPASELATFIIGTLAP